MKFKLWLFIYSKTNFVFSCSNTGTLLSQKSLLQIADELQYKSRVIIEKYVVQTMRPAFNKIYVVILTWIDAIARYTRQNVVFKVNNSGNVQ